MVKQLTPYTKKYLLYMILAPISVIFEVLLEIRIPYYMSKIVQPLLDAGKLGLTMPDKPKSSKQRYVTVLS